MFLRRITRFIQSLGILNSAGPIRFHGGINSDKQLNCIYKDCNVHTIFHERMSFR
jgi:hypothetical protein